MGISLKPAVSVLVLFAVLNSSQALAQERSSSGRHKPVPVIAEEENSPKLENEEVGTWIVELNGGLFGGGDLFNARHTNGDTIAWVSPEMDSWVSSRIRVSLEQSFGAGFQIQRRMGDWYSLRAGVSFAQMDLVAEAPIGETAEVFPYDQADVWLFNVGAEVRLTIQTPSYPYMTLDAVFVDFATVQNEFLSQSNLGGRVGLGYHYQFDPMWAINMEIGLSRSALTADYFPTPVDAEPENIEYENESSLSIFEAKFGIRLKI